jgi:long-chain acyl-CoA synthetase
MIIARVVVNEPEKSADLAKRLRDFCLDRLAPYQIPMKFEIVEHLNRTSRGKISRIEP